MHVSTIGNLDGDVWRMILDNLDWPAGTAGADAVDERTARPADVAQHRGAATELPPAERAAQ